MEKSTLGRSIALFIALPAVLITGVWYFFGETTVVATFEGKRLMGATVMLDKQAVCKTPCTFRAGPGAHRLTVVPPTHVGAVEAEREYYFFSLLRGIPITADFHLPEVEEATPEAAPEPPQEPSQ